MADFLTKLSAQFRRLVPVVLLLCIPIGLVQGGLVLYWAAGGEIAQLTRDPLAIVETELLKIQNNPDAGIHDLAALDLPFYIGAVSNFGILLWSGTAAICLFAAFCAPRRKGNIPRGMFAVAATFSAIFMLDDFFLLHERALPVYFDTSEVWLFGLYAILIAGMLLRYHKAILDSDYLLLGLAFALFAVSLAVDLVFENIRQPHFFEDGAKFAGIVMWSGYHVRNAAAAFRISPTE